MVLTAAICTGSPKTHEDWRVELPSDAVTESAQSDQQSSAVLVNAQADAQATGHDQGEQGQSIRRCSSGTYRKPEISTGHQQRSRRGLSYPLTEPIQASTHAPDNRNRHLHQIPSCPTLCPSL